MPSENTHTLYKFMQVLCRNFRPRSLCYVRSWHFPRLIIRDTNNADVIDIRVTQQQRFELCWRHLLNSTQAAVLVINGTLLRNINTITHSRATQAPLVRSWPFRSSSNTSISPAHKIQQLQTDSSRPCHFHNAYHSSCTYPPCTSFTFVSRVFFKRDGWLNLTFSLVNYEICLPPLPSVWGQFSTLERCTGHKSYTRVNKYWWSSPKKGFQQFTRSDIAGRVAGKRMSARRLVHTWNPLYLINSLILSTI